MSPGIYYTEWAPSPDPPTLSLEAQEILKQLREEMERKIELLYLRRI
jgi:hypothetical protein